MKIRIALAMLIVLALLVAGTFVFKDNVADGLERVAHKLKPLPVTKLDSVFKADVLIADSTMKGYLLISSSGDKFLWGANTILDMQGNTVWQQNLHCPSYDFRQWNINGKRYYTYGTDEKSAYHNKKVKKHISTGHFYLLDSNMKRIKAVNFLTHGKIKSEKKKALDPHDIVMLGENHFIVMIGYEQEVNNIPASIKAPLNKVVVSAVIQEIKDGKVVWQWDAADYPEFYSLNKEKDLLTDTGIADYLHANTLTLDPADSNLLVSFRDINQIVKLDRKTGNILWRLGGLNSDFPMQNEMKFYGQHTVKFTDNHRLILIDNGHETDRPFTRVIGFTLDEKARKVSKFQQYKIPHLMIPARGSVQELNGNFLICGGVSKYGLIVDPQNDEYKLHLNFNFQTYRMYWVPDIGDPSKFEKL